MEIITLGFEESLVIHKSNQKITRTPYKSKIEHVTDLGINAPRSVAIDREDIRIVKAY